MMTSIVVLASLIGCGSDVSISRNVVPPAQPPGDSPERGDVPDWQNCFQGWRGQYTNLTVDHPDVLPVLDEEPADRDPTTLDWFDNPAFEDFDATLDFGRNFWRVDEGLEGDPAYFAVRWSAWLRAWDDTEVTVVIGSSDDSWVYIDGEPVIDKHGIQPFERETISFDLDAGVAPIDVYYAHRSSEESGFAFRVVEGDVSICFPDFEDEEEESP
ncbi:MAG: PA14 domain-containing protein [Myxococcota bacterium]